MRIARPLVALALALGALGASSGPAPQPLPAGLMNQRFESVRGPATNLRHYVGRPIVLNIWATWCPPCQRELPLLESAQLTHRNITIVGVDQGEARAHVAAFLARVEVTYPILLDRSEVYGAAAGFSFPTTVFLDASGRIKGVHRGALDAASLRSGIAAITGR